MNISDKAILRILLGQTASGKKDVALDVASQLNAEIISVDSMKIYCKMDIGTAKPLLSQREKIKWHLIDIIEPSESYNVARFVEDCDMVIADVISRNKTPLLLVGTGLYLRSLLYGIFYGLKRDNRIREELEKLADEKGLDFLYNRLKEIDQVKAEKTHPNDKKRIIRALEVNNISGKPISSLQTHFNNKSAKGERYKVIIAGLKWSPENLYKRIDERIEKMFDDGLLEEVKALISAGTLSKEASQAVGYKEIIKYLKGDFALDETKELLKKNTRHLARKQMTWFRTFPQIHWIDCDILNNQTIVNELIKFFG
jgi:tRNA dimethylallyltransferase